MLNKQLYEIGKRYNNATKYNIGYDRKPLLDFVCATHISDLLEEKYPLDAEQKNKLNTLLNNLVVL